MSKERIGPITNDFYISENELHFGQKRKESNENKTVNFFDIMNEST